MTCLSLALLLVVGLSVQLHECSGEDEETCSYLYNSHPVSTMCPCTGLVQLEYSVGVLPSSSITFKWYMTQNQELAGVEGTLIEAMPGKYQLIPLIGTVPAEENGLLPGTSELFITNFCDTDEGYYWCQMVMDDTTPLEPSFPRYLTVNPDLGLCEDSTNMTDPKCVQVMVGTTSVVAAMGSSSLVSLPSPSSVSQSGQQTSMPPGITPTSTVSATPMLDSSATAPGMGRGVLCSVVSAVVAVTSAAIIGRAVMM